MLISLLEIPLLLLFSLVVIGHLLNKQDLPTSQVDAALVLGTGLDWKAEARWRHAARLYRQGLVILSSVAEWSLQAFKKQKRNDFEETSWIWAYPANTFCSKIRQKMQQKTHPSHCSSFNNINSKRSFWSCPTLQDYVPTLLQNWYGQEPKSKSTIPMLPLARTGISGYGGSHRKAGI